MGKKSEKIEDDAEWQPQPSKYTKYHPKVRSQIPRPKRSSLKALPRREWRSKPPPSFSRWSSPLPKWLWGSTLRTLGRKFPIKLMPVLWKSKQKAEKIPLIGWSKNKLTKINIRALPETQLWSPGPSFQWSWAFLCKIIQTDPSDPKYIINFPMFSPFRLFPFLLIWDFSSSTPHIVPLNKYNPVSLTPNNSFFFALDVPAV